MLVDLTEVGRCDSEWAKVPEHVIDDFRLGAGGEGHARPRPVTFAEYPRDRPGPSDQSGRQVTAFEIDLSWSTDLTNPAQGPAHLRWVVVGWAPDRP